MHPGRCARGSSRYAHRALRTCFTLLLLLLLLLLPPPLASLRCSTPRANTRSVRLFVLFLFHPSKPCGPAGRNTPERGSLYLCPARARLYGGVKHSRNGLRTHTRTHARNTDGGRGGPVHHAPTNRRTDGLLRRGRRGRLARRRRRSDNLAFAACLSTVAVATANKSRNRLLRFSRVLITSTTAPPHPWNDDSEPHNLRPLPTDTGAPGVSDHRSDTVSYDTISCLPGHGTREKRLNSCTALPACCVVCARDDDDDDECCPSAPEQRLGDAQDGGKTTDHQSTKPMNRRTIRQ
uniref:Putative secreted peptide n=1 Tax=Anopheles braziliensis TaxID=58242 RepID=A0A2M3ZMV4_9DIPT